MTTKTKLDFPDVAEEKINEVHKRGGCDSKHDTTYFLREKRDYISMEDMIQTVISRTHYRKNKWS